MPKEKTAAGAEGALTKPAWPPKAKRDGLELVAAAEVELLEEKRLLVEAAAPIPGTTADEVAAPAAAIGPVPTVKAGNSAADEEDELGNELEP